MEREFNSALPEADIRARLRAKTRPWSRAALWTARNTFFSRAGGGGEIRLAKTAAMRGYVYADICMAPLETGGTALSVTMDVPKTLYAADIGACMFFAVHLALSLALDGWPYVLLHGLRYVCVCRGCLSGRHIGPGGICPSWRHLSRKTCLIDAGGEMDRFQSLDDGHSPHRH